MASLNPSPGKNGIDEPAEGKIDDPSKNMDDCDKGNSVSSACEEEMGSDNKDDKEGDDNNSEDYVPSSNDDSNASSSVGDDSSGSEEQGVTVAAKVYGGSKFYKLKFADIEEKRKQYLSKLKGAEAEETSSSDEKEGCSTSKDIPMSDPISKANFSHYRSLLMNLGESSLVSDDDDDFNPMYCGETLSDEEDENEENTESEPEVESLEEKHKKTGETLKCIKMMENYLSIPSDFDSNEDESGSPMEH